MRFQIFLLSLLSIAVVFSMPMQSAIAAVDHNHAGDVRHIVKISSKSLQRGGLYAAALICTTLAARIIYKMVTNKRHRTALAIGTTITSISAAIALCLIAQQGMR